MKLLSTANPKIMKGEKLGYMTFILHLAPSTLSGYNACPMASKGCIAACLNTAGRGGFDPRIGVAHIRKTKEFMENRQEFLVQLVADVETGIRRAKKAGLVPAFRLNGTSDFRWEHIPVVRGGVEFPNMMTAFPDVTFYDYSKIFNRRDIPENYTITFSRSETNHAAAIATLQNGGSVAVVFSGKSLPATWEGFTVVNGDNDDLRFLDPKNVVVGLSAKGKAKKDNSGFVVKI